MPQLKLHGTKGITPELISETLQKTPRSCGSTAIGVNRNLNTKCSLLSLTIQNEMVFRFPHHVLEHVATLYSNFH